jgi:uncharacterized protein YegL
MEVTVADKKKVLVAFIQDRSGSMADGWMETLNGYKVFIEGLKKGEIEDGIEYRFSLTTFDTRIEAPIVGKPLTEVTGVELANHGPRGGTALYDAVGMTIDAISKDRHDAEKILCVIVTDGQENASREWTKDSLNKAIDAKLNEGDWTFTYLGTQPETWDDAHGIGVGVGSTATYSKGMAGQTYAAMAMMSNKIGASAVRGSRSSFTVDATKDDVLIRASAGMHVKVDNNPPAAAKGGYAEEGLRQEVALMG